MNDIISLKARQEIDKRIGNELSAEYLYRRLANAMKYLGFFGAKKFFIGESENEGKHYQKLVDFANECGYLPILSDIRVDSRPIKGINDAIGIAFDTEKELQDIYESSYVMFASEPIIQQRLLFFIEEQRKSVGEYGDLKARLAICGNDAGAIIQFDKELGRL